MCARSSSRHDIGRMGDENCGGSQRRVLTKGFFRALLSAFTRSLGEKPTQYLVTGSL
jgi:hypothetical protein